MRRIEDKDLRLVQVFDKKTLFLILGPDYSLHMAEYVGIFQEKETGRMFRLPLEASGEDLDIARDFSGETQFGIVIEPNDLTEDIIARCLHTEISSNGYKLRDAVSLISRTISQVAILTDILLDIIDRGTAQYKVRYEDYYQQLKNES